MQCRRDYIKTLTAIEAFAGANSIDLMPRFTFFSGNKELYRGLKNTKWGLKGCLTADDTRADNAGLTQQERTLITTVDDHYSFEDRMYYVKSERRLDDHNAETAVGMFNSLCSTQDNSKIFAIFVHDYNWAAKFEAVKAVMNCAKSLGIRSDYPMNNIPFRGAE